MKYITGFFQFWYDFIVGDDWTVAAVVVVALALTALLAHNAIAAWWLMPLAVALVLSASLWRVAWKK
ncbi:MAG: hypothetical protein M3Y58_20235 [Chloroflexota bacterium]|nr:hypothetical protein [Chloroflexota bacterium]